MRLYPDSIAAAAMMAAALSLVSCTRSKGDEAQAPQANAAAPSVVHVTRTAGGSFQMTRNGQPYFIKGAGGSASLQLLKDSGGNSVRTWGGDNGPTLAAAQKLGMTVTDGIWLGQHQQGFNYHDPASVAAQLQSVRQEVLRDRDSPALLVWGLGNEMEVGDEDDADMWNAIEAIAKMVHQLDPNHPTMTVVAEIGGDKVAEINKYCPDIDIVGINSYAGASSVAKRYVAAGGVKPFVITEFGPPGPWELPKNSWGAAAEPTSTQKATWYRNAYTGSIANQPLCLGSYAFDWGSKQEATATWFGMLLPDGDRTAAVDAMTESWTGHPPANPCPAIQSLTVAGPDKVAAGATVQAALAATSPTHALLTVTWELQSDPASYHTGGAAEGAPTAFPDAIKSSDSTHATVQIPNVGGAYRLFAFVRDTHGGAATANVPLFATGGASPTAAGQKATLPLVLYGAGAAAVADLPYQPSGYMGDTGAITLAANSADNPHSGKTCLKSTYSAADQWGGVVWQNPANDWGALPGGWDLSGAKQLTFWARGAQGGEQVTFKFGILGKDTTYSDTGTGTTGLVTLTPQWKQYTIDLTGQNLSRIKTGFCWVVAGQGHPVTFYLDDVRYQ